MDALTLKGTILRAHSAKRFFQKNLKKLEDSDIPGIAQILEEREAGLSDSLSMIKMLQLVAFAKSTEKGKSGKKVRKNKNFVAEILGEDGKVLFEGENELRKGFDKPQDAERWVHRKLYDEPGAHGEIEHNGESWDTISRETAMGCIDRRGPGSVLKRRPRNSSLKWLPHVKTRKGKF